MKPDKRVFDSTVAMLFLLSSMVSIGAAPTLCAGNCTMLLQVRFPGKQALEFSVQNVSLGIFWGSQLWKRRKGSRKGRGRRGAGSRLSKPQPCYKLEWFFLSCPGTA